VSFPRRPLVSVVVPSRNEGDYLRRTVNNLLAGLSPTDEVVVVDDWSTDGSVPVLCSGRYRRVRVLRPPRHLGVARARNFGARHARGDVIVFSDAHVAASRGWLRPLLAAVTPSEVGAVGPVLSVMHHPETKGYGLRFSDEATNLEWLDWKDSEPYPVPVLPGFFIAMRRDVFSATGGFDPGMTNYGMEDPELSMRLWTFGYQCRLVPGVDVAHLYRRVLPDFQLDWESGLHNVLRFGALHFGPERMQRLVACYLDDDSFPAAFTRLLDSDVWTRRRTIQRTRLHDDDWYFSRFAMP
jgi:GT2 family glycosyltransferase